MRGVSHPQQTGYDTCRNEKTMDQCNGCGYRLDEAFKQCKSADCGHHENWYAKKMREENDSQKRRITRLEEHLKDIRNSAHICTIERIEEKCNEALKDMM